MDSRRKDTICYPVCVPGFLPTVAKGRKVIQLCTVSPPSTAHPDVNFELHAWRNNYGTTCENPLHGTKAEMRRASKGVRREPGSVVTGFDGSVNTSAL